MEILFLFSSSNSWTHFNCDTNVTFDLQIVAIFDDKSEEISNYSTLVSQIASI